MLPLAVQGAGTASEYLGEGTSEELLNALSRTPGLEVIGRTSSFRFGNRTLGAREIGRQLGVRNLLSGDVRRSGNKLRIDMELDDTVTGGKCVDRYTRQEAKPSSSSPQLAVCRTHAGETASARAALQNLLADGRHRYVDRTHPAAIYAALGDGDGAMAQLEEAYRDRSAHMDGVWMDPWSSRLHGDARFEASPG